MSDLPTALEVAMRRDGLTKGGGKSWFVYIPIPKE